MKWRKKTGKTGVLILILFFEVMLFQIFFYRNGAGNTAYAGELPEAPCATLESGFYEKNMIVGFTAEEGCLIYYTLDCSDPKPGAAGTKLFEDGFTIYAEDTKTLQATVVRAVAVDEYGAMSPVTTKIYWICEQGAARYDLPVISIVTDKKNLYDQKTGIFTNQNERGKEWERPVHVTYFVDGEKVLELSAGARVHGGASRGAQTKSLRLYAREEYDADNKKFQYDFFSDGVIPALTEDGETITEFKRLLLRNGGNEAEAWESTFYRDVFTQWLMLDTRLDIQAARPVIAYLNGSFYGLMNLCEREDEKYIASHYGMKEKDIAIYEFWYDHKGELHANAATKDEDYNTEEKAYYEEAYRFCTQEDLTLAENYQKAGEYYDLADFIDYYCIECFCGNGDWPGNNCRAWRYTGETEEAYGYDGKLRFMLYDTEFGWGLYKASVSEDSIARLLKTGITEWPNPDGSTALFQNLLKNETFRQAFISRMLDLMNDALSVKAMDEKLTVLAKLYAPAIEEHKKLGRWFDAFETNEARIREYAKERGTYLYQFMDQAFSIGEPYTLRVQFDAKAESLQIGSLILDGDSPGVTNGVFSGTYASGVPVAIRVISKEGYTCAGISGDLETDRNTLELTGITQTEINLCIHSEKLPEATAALTAKPEMAETEAEEEKMMEEQQNTKTVRLAILGVLLLAAAAGIGVCLVRKK